MLVAFLIRPVLSRCRRARAAASDKTTRIRSARRWLPEPSELWPWLAFKRLTTLGFPRRFPIVQFPNLPLIVAFLASEAGRLVRGAEHSFAASVSYLAMTIWAYEELVQG